MSTSTDEGARLVVTRAELLARARDGGGAGEAVAGALATVAGPALVLDVERGGPEGVRRGRFWVDDRRVVLHTEADPDVPRDVVSGPVALAPSLLARALALEPRRPSQHPRFALSPADAEEACAADAREVWGSLLGAADVERASWWIATAAGSGRQVSALDLRSEGLWRPVAAGEGDELWWEPVAVSRVWAALTRLLMAG